MDVTNKIIQSLWINGELSTMEHLSIKSFLANGHEYHLYTYDDVKNVPSGAMIKDGNDILSKDKIFKNKKGWAKGSYSGFSDFFRWHLLMKQGGWWADLDTVCLKPFDFKAEYVIASSYEPPYGEPALNSVIKMPPNSILAVNLCYICNMKKRWDEIDFSEVGSPLLQETVVKLNLQKYIVSYQTFAPITWRAVRTIVYPYEKATAGKIFRFAKDIIKYILYPQRRPGVITRDTYGVHLWNEIWRQNNIDKNAIYDKRCLYERLKARYL